MSTINPRRKSDKVHFTVNVATLVSLLSGGAMYMRSEMDARAEAKAKIAVLEQRLIQLQGQLGETNAHLTETR